MLKYCSNTILKGAIVYVYKYCTYFINKFIGKIHLMFLMNNALAFISNDYNYDNVYHCIACLVLYRRLQQIELEYGVLTRWQPTDVVYNSIVDSR